MTTAIAQLDDLARTTLERTRVPGMGIAGVYGDETPYLKGFGTPAAGRDEPVDPDTVFQLASKSKPIASTVRDEGSYRGQTGPTRASEPGGRIMAALAAARSRA